MNIVASKWPVERAVKGQSIQVEPERQAQLFGASLPARCRARPGLGQENLCGRAAEGRCSQTAGLLGEQRGHGAQPPRGRGEKGFLKSRQGCEGGTHRGLRRARAPGEAGAQPRGAGLPGRGSPARRGSVEAGCITGPRSRGRYFRLGTSKNDKG